MLLSTSYMPLTLPLRSSPAAVTSAEPADSDTSFTPWLSRTPLTSVAALCRASYSLCACCLCQSRRFIPSILRHPRHPFS